MYSLDLPALPRAPGCATLTTPELPRTEFPQHPRGRQVLNAIMDTSRPSTVAILVIGLLTIAFAGTLVDAARLRAARATAVEQTHALAARLGLTDIALFTEARYARHPSQADLHSAFQDHPVALEHFPSGSLIPPRHENLVRTATTPD
jgi:hypothetical protein